MQHQRNLNPLPRVFYRPSLVQNLYPPKSLNAKSDSRRPAHGELHLSVHKTLRLLVFFDRPHK